MSLDPEIESFYGRYDEAARLTQGYFALEEARTRELLGRHLPPPPARLLDVGGGAGAYAVWLAVQGYAVHLVDPVPRHVEQARATFAAAGAARAQASLGDARALEPADGSAEAVLMLGPLYHLPEREDRLRALREAARVLVPGGVLFAAAISRFASLLDGLRGALFDDPLFRSIVREDLASGRHRNPGGPIEYFTTAFFHRQEELEAELREAGFTDPALFAIEGPAALLGDFEQRWADTASREVLLEAVRAVEREPALLGASPHWLAVAHAPRAPVRA
jgi:ubiquinone/menaquinone biosynthesis C-methylase UbiE